MVFFVGTPVICMGVKSESSGRNEAPESRDPVLGEMCREDFCDSVVLWGLANTCSRHNTAKLEVSCKAWK